MQIPISIFLVIWIVFILVFFVAAFVSIHQMNKFAIRGKGATLPTTIFIGVCSVVLVFTLIFLLTADWNQSLQFGDFVSSSPYISY
ncbi:MAG: hypothetical protein NUV81_02690 [bacterium]|nr:hypothetical protein [bacterium]